MDESMFICAAWRRRAEGSMASVRTLVNRCDLPDGHGGRHCDNVLLVSWNDSESDPECRPRNELAVLEAAAPAQVQGEQGQTPAQRWARRESEMELSEQQKKIAREIDRIRDLEQGQTVTLEAVAPTCVHCGLGIEKRFRGAGLEWIHVNNNRFWCEEGGHAEPSSEPDKWPLYLEALGKSYPGNGLLISVAKEAHAIAMSKPPAQPPTSPDAGNAGQGAPGELEEEIRLLESMCALLRSERGDQTAPVYRRTITRLQSILAAQRGRS